VYFFVKEYSLGLSYGSLVCFPVLKVSMLAVCIEAVKALLVPPFLGVFGDAPGFGERCPGIFVGLG